MPLLMRVLHFLLAIAFVVLSYYVVLWVFDMLGIHLPTNIVRVVFVIFAILAAIYALSGRIENWFRSP